MGKMLSALLNLQTIERRVAEVTNRLKVRRNAVAAQQRRIDQLRDDWNALHEQITERRKAADGFELDLRQREQRVAALRGALNTAKTNKEYAAILTEINTLKADNAKLEEQALNVMQDVDTVKARADGIQAEIDVENERLQEITRTSAEEIARLESIQQKLAVERRQAAEAIPPDQLALFERIAPRLAGDAMAPVEVHGSKPPYDYVCGGCFMSLNAEHANALRTRDEIRTCDSCGRILYMEVEARQKM